MEDDLHKAIKIRVAEEETTLKDYIIALIRKDLQKSKSTEK